MNLAQTTINAFLDRKLAQPSTALALPSPEERNLTKAILAGAIAGLAATAAKTFVDKVYPPHPQAVPVEQIHWATGAAIGAAYGGLAEFYPAASSREGVSFGMTLMALTHETTPAVQSSRETTSEIASHVVFGLVVEATRRIVRKML